MFVLEFLLLAGLRAVSAVVACLPVNFSIFLFRSLVRGVWIVLPRYREIARSNLALAFPAMTEREREGILERSSEHLARLLVDFFRMPCLTPQWVERHIECPFLQRYREIKKDRGGGGILIVTGHLGSFELLAHSMPMLGHPIAFVVRNFKLPRIDRWWTKMREAYGNRVINRKGAFQEATRVLQSGMDVAILFDQNVTRKHAVFVEWFGVEAATTKMPAVMAIRAECPVVVASIEYRGSDSYIVNAEEMDFAAIYADPGLSTDDKIRFITERLVSSYERMIRRCPEAWFWMHRRWKTKKIGTPHNEPKILS